MFAGLSGEGELPRAARRYVLREGMLWYGKKGDAALLVPPPTDWTRLVNQAHSVAHAGPEKVHEMLQQQYFWPKMFDFIRLMVQSCDLCQRVNQGRTERLAIRPIIPRSAQDAFDEVWMDLIGEVPTSSRGNRYVLVMIDSRTRYAVAVPLQSKTAEEVVGAFMTEWIYRFTPPRRLRFDQGSEFSAEVGRRIFELFGIDFRVSSSFHPNTQGTVERLN